MCDGDFDPPGWRPDNEDASNDDGSAGWGCFYICLGIIVSLMTLGGC
jgi:hypothetical protein